MHSFWGAFFFERMTSKFNKGGVYVFYICHANVDNIRINFNTT